MGLARQRRTVPEAWWRNLTEENAVSGGVLEKRLRGRSPFSWDPANSWDTIFIFWDIAMIKNSQPALATP